MISQMEMDLLEIQAVNMLIEINLEFKELDEEGREDATIPGLSSGTSRGGGESVGGGEGEVYSRRAGG